MMYLKLSEKYGLRSWKNASCGLLELSTNRITWVNPTDFSFLLLCDGSLDRENAISLGFDSSLKKALERQWIISSSEPGCLSPHQVLKKYDNRYIGQILWSLTGRCNYRCRHCYMDAPDGALGEISHEEAITIIDEMAECGVGRVQLTGGEPLIRKDFWQLVDRMIGKNIVIDSIYSNGKLVTDTFLDKLEERGIRPEISISFDGLGWHDWLRGVKGAEESALSAIERSVKRGHRVSVEISLHKGSVSSLGETIRKLAAMGVSFIKVGDIFDSPLWRSNADGMEMSFREYADAMVAYIPQYYEDGAPVSLQLSMIARLKPDGTYRVEHGISEGSKRPEESYLCGAARFTGYITPDGRLAPCMPITGCDEEDLKQFPKICESGLKKALSDGFYIGFVSRRLKDLLAVNSRCNACEYRYLCCGGCRAHSLFETHDLMGYDSHACYLYRNGYPERIQNAIEAGLGKI